MRLTTLLATAATTTILTLTTAGTAHATTPPAPCTTHVIDTPAYDETIIDQPATPAVPGQWWNWSPNNDQGPFDGPPTFPTDDRGTWQGPHTDGGPDGEGTYQAGDGHGSWFHRDPGTPAQPEVSHVVHHDATYKDVPVDCPPTRTPHVPPAPKPHDGPFPVKVTDATPSTSSTDGVLPDTGGVGNLYGLAAGGLMAAAGATVLVRARRRA